MLGLKRLHYLLTIIIQPCCGPEPTPAVEEDLDPTLIVTADSGQAPGSSSDPKGNKVGLEERRRLLLDACTSKSNLILLKALFSKAKLSDCNELTNWLFERRVLDLEGSKIKDIRELALIT